MEDLRRWAPFLGLLALVICFSSVPEPAVLHDHPIISFVIRFGAFPVVAGLLLWWALRLPARARDPDQTKARFEAQRRLRRRRRRDRA